MKKIFFGILVITITSFIGKDEIGFKINNIKKNYAKVKDDFYVCKYEVSNLDYRNFLSDLTNLKESETYKNCLPDTLCWVKKNVYCEPLVVNYFRYPAYDNYPVVGVSYEAAKEYCSWLTKRYNEDSKRRYKKLVFKLLNREEWTYAANKGDTSKVYTWGSGFMQNNRKQYLCHFRHTKFVYDSLTKKYTEIPVEINGNMHSLIDRTLISGPVKAYYPSSFGMYNMCGNVAEMIEEKGIAKGGSYNDPFYKVTISSEYFYSEPQADIGFRVAMKIIED